MFESAHRKASFEQQLSYGATQVLRNVDGGGGGVTFFGKSVTKVYGSTLLALRGWGSKFHEKSVT